MSILDIFRKFLKDDETKALIDLDSNVDIDSKKTAGKGQVGKILNKGDGDVVINNNNYNVIQLPSDIKPNSEEFKEITKIVKAEFEQGGLQLIEKQYDDIIIGYKDFEKNSSYVEIANFFKGKICESDFQNLRTGLYIRYLSDNNRKDEALRIKDNSIRNNQRTRNIINLASAGYFEDYIQPIYENNDIEIFKNEYEEVVCYMPEIIFVNNKMTVGNIMSEIEEKLAHSEQYHLQVKCIMINGLNQCVDIIKESEEVIRKKYPKYNVYLEIGGSTSTLLSAKMKIKLDEFDSIE